MEPCSSTSSSNFGVGARHHGLRAVRQRLKEVAGFKIPYTDKSEANNHPDIEPTQKSLKGARAYKTPRLWSAQRQRSGVAQTTRSMTPQRRNEESVQQRMLAVKKPTLERYIIQTNLFRTWAKAHRKSNSDHNKLDSWLNTYWSCMKMGCMFGKEPMSSTVISF